MKGCVKIQQTVGRDLKSTPEFAKTFKSTNLVSPREHEIQAVGPVIGIILFTIEHEMNLRNTFSSMNRNKAAISIIME